MALDKPIWVAGCMTGTSMDGLDVACVKTDGVAIYEFGASEFRPFTTLERACLAKAQGQWQDGADVAAAAKVIEDVHIETLRKFPDVDLIGFHGQTLAHDPSIRRTHQAGNGAVLAEHLGRPVVWDFRTADVTLGGQGAPLAPIYHAALVNWLGIQDPVVLLNLGGVGNLTWVDPSAGPLDLLAFDTGPANAPLDDFIVSRTGKQFDIGGILARSGCVCQPILDQVFKADFFAQTPPKSLDRNEFCKLIGPMDHLSVEDGAATLVAIMVQSVIKALDYLPHPPTQILVSGGGAQNAFVMDQLSIYAPCPVNRIDTFHIDPSMVEAQAFAYLAARVKAGLSTSFSGTTGVMASVGGGIISGG